MSARAKATPRPADTCKCGGCGKTFEATELDAVLLDPEGNDASSEAYCRTCFPWFRCVEDDIWRRLAPVERGSDA